MTTLTLERPRMTVDAPSLFDVSADGSTLEALVSGAWEGLSAEATTACPVCGGELVARYVPGDGIESGDCRDCHSSLS